MILCMYVVVSGQSDHAVEKGGLVVETTLTLVV